MLTSILFLVLWCVIAVIVIEVACWLFAELLGLAIPPRIQQLLRALVAIYAIIGLISILLGSHLSIYPH